MTVQCGGGCAFIIGLNITFQLGTNPAFACMNCTATTKHMILAVCCLQKCQHPAVCVRPTCWQDASVTPDGLRMVELFAGKKAVTRAFRRAPLLSYSAINVLIQIYVCMCLCAQGTYVQSTYIYIYIYIYIEREIYIKIFV